MPLFRVLVMEFIKAWLFLGLLVTMSCDNNSAITTFKPIAPDDVAVFSSTDKKLEKAYQWARKTALSYTRDDTAPIGLWYVASLPIREAFCMRDVSHQSVGAQILGLGHHNKNMLTHIVNNISEERDWCSYWEINRYGRPVPADYFNDKEFWYNLTANHDVIQACFKLYDWTGDDEYINGRQFANFYAHSAIDFVERWQLLPGQIMERPPYMNKPDNFDPRNEFHICRGIPSYDETIPALALGIDLVASLYGGNEAYSKILAQRGDIEQAVIFHEKAIRYRDLIHARWWDNEKSRFHSSLTHNGLMMDSEGAAYLLWFNAVNDPDRIHTVLEDMLHTEGSIQYVSYFPELFYKYGYYDDGYDYITKLPTLSMSEYPEVAFSLVSGCVCGVMGITPSYIDKSITTLCRVRDPRCDSRIDNMAMFDGYMSVRHVGNMVTEITNNTSLELNWNVSFLGDFPSVKVAAKNYPTERHKDINGNIISTASITLPANTTFRAQAVTA